MKKTPEKTIEEIVRELRKSPRIPKRTKTLISKLKRMFSEQKKDIGDQALEIKTLERRVSDVIIERNKRFDEGVVLKEKMRALNDLGDYLARASKGVIIVVTDNETKWKESKKT